MTEVTIDFVAAGEEPDIWRVVLVEQGPWPPPATEPLKRLQQRLYDCIDIIIDGALAERFPQTRGVAIQLRLDAYNVPEDEVSDLFRKISEFVSSEGEYAEAIAASPHISELTFELNVERIH